MHKKRAFTLTELSVSLTIISLIVGTIMSGLYIKRRAELNAIMDEVAKLKAAYANFVTVYSALPGDLHLSSSAFGTGSIAGITILYGNGNGIIDNASSAPYEGLIALQHLAFANLIPGSYLGNTSTVTNSTNWFYKNPIDPTYGYYFGSNTNSPGGTFSVFDSNLNDKRSSLVIYAKMSNNSISTKSVLSPTEMYKLDYKFDDGYPTTGNVLAAGGSDNSSGCINTSPTPNSYKVSPTKGCYLAIIMDKKSKL